jgi:hypothetical protein
MPYTKVILAPGSGHAGRQCKQFVGGGLNMRHSRNLCGNLPGCGLDVLVYQDLLDRVPQARRISVKDSDASLRSYKRSCIFWG